MTTVDDVLGVINERLGTARDAATVEGLQRIKDMLRAIDSFVVPKCKHVMFEVDNRGRACRVLVDGVERFRIDDAQQIEFGYALAAARSEDRHSYSAPPMKWGEQREDD